MVRQKSRTESESKYRRRALFFSILAISLFISVYVLAPVAIGTSDSDTIQFGNMTATTTLSTVALGAGGEPAEGMSTNSPLYMGTKEVWMLGAYIDFDATGEQVDWGSVVVDIDLEVNGRTVESWTFYGSEDATSHHESVQYNIANLDDYLTTAYGGELYVRARADVSYSDHAENGLNAQDMALNVWSFTAQTGGSGDADPSPTVTEPTFTEAPADLTMTQGDSNILVWRATDDNPSTYTIKTYSLYDGQDIVQIGIFSDGISMSWDAGEFISQAAGDYQLKVACIIEDADGNVGVDQVVIQVTIAIVPDAPTWLSTDGVTSTYDRMLDDPIIFRPRSEIPQSYKLYLNGELIDSGSWDGGDIHTLPKMELPIGGNVFKCVVWDTQGRDSSRTWKLTVLTEADDIITRTIHYKEEPPQVNSPFGTGVGISMLTSLAVIMSVALYYTIKWMVEK
ncbi:MAG: hypothetical protein ACXADS_12610 [Candidatus Thorarchaeota archaeon]